MTDKKVLLINRLEADALSLTIKEFLSEQGIELDPSITNRIATILWFHGGLAWDESQSAWVIPETGEIANTKGNDAWKKS